VMVVVVVAVVVVVMVVVAVVVMVVVVVAVVVVVMVVVAVVVMVVAGDEVNCLWILAIEANEDAEVQVVEPPLASGVVLLLCEFLGRIHGVQLTRPCRSVALPRAVAMTALSVGAVVCLVKQRAAKHPFAVAHEHCVPTPGEPHNWRCR
jgi:hypothetical protein